MRILLLRLVAGLLLTVGTLAFTAGAPKAALDARASLVSLWFNEDGTWVFICSGNAVRLGSKRYIVTAAHCVTDEKRNPRLYTVRTQDGAKYPVLEFTAVNNQEPQDSALLRSPATYTIPALHVAASLEQGDALYVWHQALGFQALFSAGIYQGKITTLDGDTYFQSLWGMLKTSLEVAPGASGSVVVNEAGEAVGVISRRLPVETGMSGAILSPMPR